ncbi:MAG TPA: N-formylglutamate amidohydrolase [Caulobacteraceae bacterium]|nr:N-formylglutamate amidohydrolase [Caulobacteraceae bacterium]
MNAWERSPRALEVTPEEDLEAFVVERPLKGAPVTPLVFASPHSGRIYPRTLNARLAAPAIRGSEDAFVDELIAPAPRFGVRAIAARLARVFVDVNRHPFELDPAMFEDDLPHWARARTPRVAAGLGAIAKIVREGEEVYDRKLSFSEARWRIEAAHRPYHAALSALVAEAKAAAGLAILVDWHSMPTPPAGALPCRGRPADIVIGDRFGCSCASAVARLFEAALTDLGYRVARNSPYAGGYTTEHYGAPGAGVHALQIEIARSLYLEEASLTPTAGFAALAADLERLFALVAGLDWRALTR